VTFESLGCQLAVHGPTERDRLRTPVRISNSIWREATTGFEPVIAVLQTTTTALLGDFRGSPRVQISHTSGAVEG
jgi:hypothetical protein